MMSSPCLGPAGRLPEKLLPALRVLRPGVGQWQGGEGAGKRPAAHPGHPASLLPPVPHSELLGSFGAHGRRADEGSWLSPSPLSSWHGKGSPGGCSLEPLTYYILATLSFPWKEVEAVEGFEPRSDGSEQAVAGVLWLLGEDRQESEGARGVSSQEARAVSQAREGGVLAEVLAGGEPRRDTFGVGFEKVSWWTGGGGGEKTSSQVCLKDFSAAAEG